MYIVWPSVLSLNNLKIHNARAVKNTCIQEKSWVNVNPLLNLPVLFWARSILENTRPRYALLKLKPALWSRDTDQRMLCFDRCQLTSIKGGCWSNNNNNNMSLIPFVNKCYNELLKEEKYMEYGRHLARLLVFVVVVRSRPRAIPLFMITTRKSTHG